MNGPMIEKYAALICDYCLYLKAEEKLYIRTSTLAVPLAKAVYLNALQKGVIVEIDFEFEGQSRSLLAVGNENQLSHKNTLHAHAMEHFDAYLAIRAPHNLVENHDVDKAKMKIRTAAMKSMSDNYFRRTADGSMKRSLCQFPTQASAQMAGMSLEEYSEFVFNACRLFDDNPKKSWLQVREDQQHIVDYLNKVDKLQYITNGTDISFSVKDRIWINSDGRSNMPSGEVFSGPVEDSVNGTVYFNFPSVFSSRPVKGITLEVKDGKVMNWQAEEGQELLDEIFEIPGARYFGEVAIGTNYNIQQATKNILFDEKIGGTIHMAIGQSYIQTGGKNKSAIHWDMITDMSKGGQIVADGKLIYENGKFLF